MRLARRRRGSRPSRDRASGTQTPTQASVQRPTARCPWTGRRGSICARCWRRRPSRSAGRCAGRSTTRASPDGILYDARSHQPDAAAGGRPVRRRGARRAGDGIADGRRRRCGADARRRAAQCRHAAGQGDRAEDRRAARRCRHQHQRCGQAPTASRRTARRSPSSRAARARPLLPAGPLCGARRAGPGARRARGRGAGRQPGPRRDPAQRRPRAADRGGPRRRGPARAPVFSISEDDPDAPKGRREVARSAARQAEFALPPGTYYVIARQGGVETRELLALDARRYGAAHADAGGRPPRAVDATERRRGADGGRSRLLSRRAARRPGPRRRHHQPADADPAAAERPLPRRGPLRRRSMRAACARSRCARGRCMQLVLEHQAARAEAAPGRRQVRR